MFVRTKQLSWLELVEERPRLGPLRELLERDGTVAEVAGGASAEESVDMRAGVTWDSMLARVQASEAQLRAGLVDLGAFEFDGRWHVLEAPLLHAVFELVLWLLSDPSPRQSC